MAKNAAAKAMTPTGRSTFFQNLTPVGTCGSFGSPYHSGWSPCANTVTTPVPPTPGGSYTAAWAKPLALSCSTRESASASMSSLVPKCRQPVGHAFTHAGSSPTSTRSTQSVHLAILSVRAEYRGTSNGHPVSHILQPMQASGFTSTMPFSYCTIAPGAGQALKPMQVEVSMYLETTAIFRWPVAPPHICADDWRICSPGEFMTPSPTPS